MDANTEISRVAIVGTGLIGSSWAACFLAHGLDVVATDPAPGTEDKVRQIHRSGVGRADKDRTGTGSVDLASAIRI
jgi:3-hydroxyacyl-CoA dehydrogenase